MRSVTAPRDAYDLLTVVMLRLGDPDEADSRSILRLLDVLLSSELQSSEKKAILTKDFDVPMTTSLNEEMNEVCNLAEGIREKAEMKGQERGEKIGQERGEKIGEKRGEKRGAQETRIDVALNLMNTLKMSAEDVLNAMRVPARSRASLLKTIKERLAAE